MITLLRLHGLQLRKLLGLWGLLILGAAFTAAWWTNTPEINIHSAWICQLLVAPLGLIAALRADVLAWIVPISRTRRVNSHIVFATLMAALGALGALALLRELGDTTTLPLKIASLTVSGLLATMVVGGVYLMAEDAETIFGAIMLVFFVAIDIGLTYWQLKQPFSTTGFWGIAFFTAMGIAFYITVYVQTELPGPRPATGFVPASPQFPDNPDRFVRPSRRPEPVELVWPNRPGSPEGAALLGISSELRKGRSLGRILLRKVFTGYGVLFLLPLGFWFLSSFGSMMIQQYTIITAIQTAQSLKTWSYFTHTPIPRWKALAFAGMYPLAFWIVLAVGALIQVPFSDTVRFLPDAGAEERANPQYFSYIRLSQELGVADPSLREIGYPKEGLRSLQDPGRLADFLSTYLKRFFNVEASPQTLLTLRPDTSSWQTAWLYSVMAHYESQLRWSLLRRRVYDLLSALFLACAFMLGILLAPKARYWNLLLMVPVGLFYFAVGIPDIRAISFRIGDAFPWLTIPALLGLIAVTLYFTYRAFREWTPVTRREPLRHLRIR